MFVSSGVYAYVSDFAMIQKFNDVCLLCNQPRAFHDRNDWCYDADAVNFDIFNMRGIELEDFEHFYFRRCQYLTTWRDGEIVCL